MIALRIAQHFCYCEKDNSSSLPDSGRQIFYWLNYNAKSTLLAGVSLGEERGLLSRTVFKWKPLCSHNCVVFTLLLVKVQWSFLFVVSHCVLFTLTGHRNKWKRMFFVLDGFEQHLYFFENEKVQFKFTELDRIRSKSVSNCKFITFRLHDKLKDFERNPH